MKVRAYVLIASVALLGMSAGSKKAKLTEGVNPGDLAPRIEFLGNDARHRDAAAARDGPCAGSLRRLV